MKIEATSPDDYISKLTGDRKEAITKLRKAINDNLPKGFEETMSYGMIGWVVPLKVYPSGYHCDTSLPLPFMSIASQKNFIGFYHMGIYADPDLYQWFTDEYKKWLPSKLDMGKSCVRLKKPEQIPHHLFGDLASKMSVQNWINLYERNLKR